VVESRDEGVGAEAATASAENTPEAADSIRDRVAARAVLAADELARAQATLSAAQRTQRLWGSLNDQLGEGLLAGAFHDAKRIPATNAAILAPEEAVLLEKLIERAEPLLREAMDEMPRDLPAAMDVAGVALDASARHPIYTTDNGFITIDVDDRRFQATITSRGGSPRRTPADVPTILAEVVKLRERLFGGQRTVMTPDALLAAYETARQRAGLGAGADVPLAEVRDALASGKQAVPPDEFNVDLGRILAETTRYGSPRFAVSNTRDMKRGVLLYGMEQAGYVGYLRFEGDLT